MNKEIAFFDLDNTLWYISSDVWVIDKDNPAKPIMKISPIEFALIKGGIYVKDDILIDYNNESFFISKDMLERIQRKKKIRLGNIGISYREFFDEEILQKKEVKLLINNIKHLIGNNKVDIGVLTARSDRKKHTPLLNKLRLKLKEYGLEITKIYFISDTVKTVGYQDKVTYDKNRVLLEHLVGLTIEDDKFIPVKKMSYNKIHFYDDIKSNFLSVNKLQDYFDFLVRNSEDEVIEYINNRLKNNLVLHNNLITNNEVNPFETNIIKLEAPIKFPMKVSNNKLTVKFEKFKN